MVQQPTTILLVEDNALNQKMLTLRLEKSGFQVVSRDDGHHLIAVVNEVQPATILLDMQLPDKDGWSLARALKADRHTASIPLIAVTAFAMCGDRENCIAAGCDAYITKPINFPLLLQTMQTLMEDYKFNCPYGTPCMKLECPFALSKG